MREAASAAGPGVTLGIYEKGLAWAGDWDAFFADARAAGFSFVDLSVDETPERMGRLEWSAAERADVREASLRQGVSIGGICLSAHRAVGPGSADPETRARALTILMQAIDLCVDLGAPLLQVAGYFAYYEPKRPGARGRYVEIISAGADYAARRGVMLGIENVDGPDVASISHAIAVSDEIRSAYVQLYPDIGNLVEHELSVETELAAGRGRMLALHAKDTRPGEARRVPMGGGDVPWDRAFAELARQGWSGRMLIEMWNDLTPDPRSVAEQARIFVETKLAAAGIAVLGRRSARVAEHSGAAAIVSIPKHIEGVPRP